MKLLITSDVHIYPWIAYSKIDSLGVPSRLSLYEDLASSMYGTAIKELCDYCLIAGDFLNSPENKPMTLTVAKRFLQTISQACPVILTDGQHDMDTKSKFVNPIHSIAALFHEKEVKYIHEGIVDLNGIKMYVHGWDPEGVLIEESFDSETKIYMGHGVVSGSSTPDGFIFKNGISSDKLMDRYELSIIGDIHNSAQFTRDGKLVLVPGPPVQNSFKDPVVCGYWVIELSDTGKIQETKFIRVTEPPFHKFVTSNEIVQEDEYTHVRVKTTSKNINVINTKESVDTTDALKIIKSEASLLKPDNLNLVLSLIDTLFSSIKSHTSKNIPESYISKVKIEGFGNISEYDIDFSSIPSPLLITGNNGSGKSTFLDSIYWALTGISSKKVKVDKIVNKYYPNGCSVMLSLVINGEEIHIHRTRNHSKYGTSLRVIKNDVSIEKSTTADTQNLIYATLGLKPSLILSSCYLSSRNVNIFGDLSAAEKNDLMSCLSDTEVLDEFRQSLKNLSTTTLEEKLVVSGSLNSVSESILNINNMLESVSESESVDEKFFSSHKEALKSFDIFVSANLKESLESKLENLKKILSSFNESLYEKRSNLTWELKLLTTKIQAWNSRIPSIEAKIKDEKLTLDKISSSKCSYCDQDIVSQEKVSELKFKSFTRINDLVSEFLVSESSLKACSQEYELLLEKFNPVNEAISAFESIRKKIEDLNNMFLSYVKFEKDNNKSVNTDFLTTSLRQENEKLDKIKTKFNELASTQLALDLIAKLVSRNGSVVRKILESSCMYLSKELEILLLGSEVSAKITVGKEIDLSCTVNEESRDYDELSSGEKQIVDLAMLIAFNNTISRKFNQPHGLLGLIALDEVFSYLDPKNAEVAQQIVNRSVSKNIMIVTHDSNLQRQFTNVLAVTKENNLANYELFV